MAEQTHFDVVIIGGGPGGYAAALYGTGQGLNIAMIERDIVGGTCLHRGCIPAKEFLETAHVFRTVGASGDHGVEAGEPKLKFEVAQKRKQNVVETIYKGLSGLLSKKNVTVFAGTGTLGPNKEVKVTGGESGDVTLTADAVILAAGSAPRTIPGFDVDGKIVVTSDELLMLEELPARAAVIGGGAIGCEFASMMSDLGTDVTILEALPKILPGLDEDVTKEVLRSFKKRNIDVKTGVQVTGHEPGDNGTTVSFGDGETLEVDMVVVSVGRRPLGETLGLEGTSVKVDEKGFVVVDEYCRTGEDGVYAVGDVIATAALAHVGYAEGVLAIDGILGENPIPVDYTAVPWCIYCHPEVAFAGYSEEAAKEAGYDVVTSKHRYGGNGRAMIIGDNQGLVKIIAEKQDDGTGGRILGVHMVGPWVTEQLGMGYLAVNWEATAEEVARFIQPHPTLTETFGETVMTLAGRSLHG